LPAVPAPFGKPSLARLGALSKVPFGAGVVYTMYACQHLVSAIAPPPNGEPTFGKEASLPIAHVPTQEPTISKVIIALDQLYPISFCQTQFIGAPSDEVVYDKKQRPRQGIAFTIVSRSHLAM